MQKTPHLRMVLKTLTTTPYAGIIRIRFATIVAGSGKRPFQSQPTFASAPPVVLFKFYMHKNNAQFSFCQEEYVDFYFSHKFIVKCFDLYYNQSNS